MKLSPQVGYFVLGEKVQDLYNNFNPVLFKNKMKYEQAKRICNKSKIAKRRRVS